MLTAALSGLTVVLSFVSVPFAMGLRIHFFQVGIMLAGAIGGPVSGLITGSIGGLYIAMIRSDPTIVVGNGLLGLFTGLLVRKIRPALAALVAWVLVQAPWIYLTGTFILGVPSAVMQLILVLLTLEDAVCAVVVDILVRRFHLRAMVFPDVTTGKGAKP
jgi:LytS/YehU family sensor histidine kinase